MNLNNFESDIDPVILERGYDYYESEAVVSLKEIETNKYAAEVEGTDLYTVNVELNEQGDITYTVCDCPYDRGKYCKHQAAVLLALREIKEQGSLRFEKSGEGIVETPLPSRLKNKSCVDIRSLLEGRTREELIHMLVGIASEQEEVKQRIELSFGCGSENDELKKAAALIRSYANKYADYYNMEEAVKGAEMVLESAWYIAETERAARAVALALCVIRETIDLLCNSDDSEGMAENVVSSGLDLIGKVAAGEGLAEADRRNMFNSLLTEAGNPLYDEREDCRVELLQVCAVFSTGIPELCAKLDEILASLIDENSWGGNFYDQKLSLIRYQMIERLHGEEKALSFIKEHIQYSEFRKMAIEEALLEQNYDEAVNLARDGEERDQDKPGLVRLWREYLCKTYRLTGNIEGLRNLAMDFILDGRFEYYQELKRTYGAAYWLGVYPGIIQMLENGQRTSLSVYTDILIEEGEKQKLIEHVGKDVSRIMQFYKYLLPEYRDIVFKMYRQYIEYAAERANCRNGYKGVCAIIRNLKKAGGREQVVEVKQALLTRYPRRPALRDELSKV